MGKVPFFFFLIFVREFIINTRVAEGEEKKKRRKEYPPPTSTPFAHTDTSTPNTKLAVVDDDTHPKRKRHALVFYFLFQLRLITSKLASLGLHWNRRKVFVPRIELMFEPLAPLSVDVGVA